MCECVKYEVSLTNSIPLRIVQNFTYNENYTPKSNTKISESVQIWVIDTSSVSITNIQPSHGWINGKTIVSVIGQNFPNANEIHCQFGNQTFTAQYVSTTIVLCETPPNSKQTIIPKLTFYAVIQVSFFSRTHTYVFTICICFLHKTNRIFGLILL